MEERTDAPYWIYDKENNMFPEYGEFFKKIEKALGFELFTWQKTFIIMGTQRRNGKTLSMILRDLFMPETPYIDFTSKPRTHREMFYRQELLKIKRQLTDAGIETKPVFTSKKEINEYLKGSERKWQWRY